MRKSASWDRRFFLKACLAGAWALLGGLAFPKGLGAGEFPEGRLALFNIHTGERARVTYRDSAGEYDREALGFLNWILRCHYSGQVARMDIRAIEFLNLVDKSVGEADEIHIISGFRSPEYNDLLIRQGRGVAKHSLHLLGKAIDISIPGMDLGALRQAALSLRYGGVGYYPQSGFIHLDAGRFRSW